jgi:hypothetical protein
MMRPSSRRSSLSLASSSDAKLKVMVLAASNTCNPGPEATATATATARQRRPKSSSSSSASAAPPPLLTGTITSTSTTIGHEWNGIDQSNNDSRPVRAANLDRVRPATAPSSVVSAASAASAPSVPRIALATTEAFPHQLKLKSFAASRGFASNLSDLRVLKQRSTGRHLSPLSPGDSARDRSPSTEAKSSATKRSPASFSANGIETSHGPPPSLITRSSYQSDLARRAQNPAASALAAQQHKPYNNRPALLSPTALQFPTQPLGSLDAVMSSRFSAADPPLPPSRSGDRYAQSDDEIHESIESSQSNEDLFLKLAQDSISDLRADQNGGIALERQLVSLYFVLLAIAPPKADRHETTHSPADAGKPQPSAAR